ncbi:hypothetical protein JS756_23070 [Streptomyces actuosus]|uniref:Lipoprotein n=1 Tax=Streptomyces actuosus TaxID=1885 RepID=A0ABS2VV58_STRAS|nr:hypothetical protein [Streptomyces actuosus]MBN0046943.1 hypothetical protein [Streptomyces actuosus]
MRTTRTAPARGLLLAGALSAAVLTAATACGPADDHATGTPAPSTTTAAPTPPSSSPSPSSVSPSPAPASAAAADAPCAGDRGGVDLQLHGHGIHQDIVTLSAQEGRWDCADPDGPTWHTTGPVHEVRLAETARITVNRPFYDTGANRPIGVQPFLDRLDTAAKDPWNVLVFSYSTDPGDASVVRLDQRRMP